MTAPDVLLTPEEAAEVLRLPVRQLQTWRYLGVGPPYIKVGRAVRYARSDLNAWLLTQRVEPEATP